MSDGEVFGVWFMGLLIGAALATMVAVAITLNSFEEGQCAAISGEYNSELKKCVVDDRVVDLPGAEQE